ncbi:interleukin-1 receptor-associated kinase 4 [Elysia marginata]|uniref:Interleukin-1 receptor-associated kinase 4 n=1 Tax=Elysia marginata TaxID=1093978 RepID=A0AAV4EZL4_9GAST|nr:interleukin-1 receptor-associated kinase 4 [Elysia marginata]
MPNFQLSLPPTVFITEGAVLTIFYFKFEDNILLFFLLFIQVLRLTNLGYAANIIERDILHKSEEELGKNSDSQSPSEETLAHNSSLAGSDNDKSSLKPEVASERVPEMNGDVFTNGKPSFNPSICSELSDRLSDISETFGMGSVNLGVPVAVPLEEKPGRIRVDGTDQPSRAGEVPLGLQDKILCARSTLDSPSSPESNVVSSKVTKQVDRGWASAGVGEISGKVLISAQPTVDRSSEPQSSSPDSSLTSDLPLEHQALLRCAGDLHKIPYDVLRDITDNFNAVEESKGGRLLGEGGFGNVFLGQINSTHRVAVKRLKDNTEDTVKQFLAEIKV